MTVKLKILLAVIALEIALLGFWFYQRSEGSASAPAVGENYFALPDTAGINQIVLGANTFRLVGGEWQLNERYPADKPLLRELFALMRKVEVRQLITGTEGESLRQEIQTKGQTVDFRRGNSSVVAFKVLDVKGNTYALAPKSQSPAALYIPGYGINVYEALTLPEGEWRNKNLVSAGWSGIRALRIRYAETPEQSIDIRRQDDFYKVEGVRNLDSAMLYRYIESYRNFRVYGFSDNAALRDSLNRLEPFCQMEIETPSATTILHVYAGKSGMFGITHPANELVVLEPRYFARFLARRKDFERQ